MIDNVNYNNSVRFSARCNQVKMLDRDGKFTGEVIGEEFKDADLPVYDFAEYMAEKMGFPDTESFFEYIHGNRELPTENSSSSKTVEINGQVYNIDDIQFAKIDLFSAYKLSYEITPTGDHEHDYQLQMGLNYNMSCVDDTNLQDYDKLTAEEDFTGMSAAEIYKAIYEKYQHCYGENFIDINAVPYVSANGTVDTFRGLISRFQMDVKSAIGSSDYADVQEARREALYGDMDDYEVRAAIMEKYAADGFTNADLYKATAEMDRCGVGGGIHNVLQSVLTKDRSQILYNSSLGIKTSVETACAMYEEMLASPLDADMLEYIEIYGKEMGAISPKLYSALDQLRENCGAYSGGISVDSLSADSSQNSDFTWVKL